MALAKQALGMTVQQARKLAAHQLVFGDPDQVRAVRLLAVYEEATIELGLDEGEVCDHCATQYRNMDIQQLREHMWGRRGD